MTTSSTSSLGC